MKTTIVATPEFEWHWPFTADHLLDLLPGATLTRQATLEDLPGDTERLISLGALPTNEDLDHLPALAEMYVSSGYRSPAETDELLESRGIRQLRLPSEGYWGQSVSEFALGLTIGALRRIPQTHHEIIQSLDPWNYSYGQYADDPNFTAGTVEGTRVRIVGAGNIASRYASFTHMLGADVAAWDPFAAEPSFHRSGARRVHHLENLLADAEIFAPMVPLLPSTKGLITAEHIRALPRGCLVVLVTRATVVDMPELRRRVLDDELSLAADVFDVEPVPLEDPLLGRHNVVHTPHNAGRTRESNLRLAEALAALFPESGR
ncbi:MULTISPECIES: NAD(P)-dependent oxidoreductase [unclassified Streptosporangium]|uniref:NAD(P)-dependent oxidoreductase n=1 Tax=unclassified Streptosporangium TaxID=2632669 RepID=UPI002E2E5C9C|nr:MULTISPECIES: NAD(P)-dependent oxidoreductase [unclassified Streptosporangium]